MSAFKIMRLRIVTSRTMMRAALRKNGEPETGTVNNGFFDNTGYSYLHVLHLRCAFSRKRSGGKCNLQVESTGCCIHIEQFPCKIKSSYKL